MQPTRQYREDSEEGRTAETLRFDFEGVRFRALRWSYSCSPSEAVGAQNVSRETFEESVGTVAGLPLVFLHGFAQNADAWEEVARCVSSQLRMATVRVGAVQEASARKTAAREIPAWEAVVRVSAARTRATRTNAARMDAVRADIARETAAQVDAVRPEAARGAAVQVDAERCAVARVGAVYALDFVGHGRSDKPESAIPYSMGFTCSMLLAFLRFVQQENAGRAPIVVGYSMGGRIALAAVCRALGIASSASEPDPPLSALVLESAGLGPDSEEARAAVAQANARRARALRDEGIERFMDEWERLPLFSTQQELPDEMRARLRAGRLANDAEALARTLEGTGAQHMSARSECLAALAALAKQGIPVRYLAGQRDEKYRKLAECLRGFVGDFSDSRFLADNRGDASRQSRSGRRLAGQGAAYDSQASTSALVPSASIEALVAPGVGHNIHLENPEWFSRWLLSFAYNLGKR